MKIALRRSDSPVSAEEGTKNAIRLGGHGIGLAQVTAARICEAGLLVT